MPRARKRDGSPQARGRKSWVKGSKLVFLISRGELWRQAIDSNRAGEFYTRVTKLWLKKYPHSLPLDQDLEIDVEDPADETLDDGFEQDSDMTEEEAKEMSLKFKQLRQVCISSLLLLTVAHVKCIDIRK